MEQLGQQNSHHHQPQPDQKQRQKATKLAKEPMIKYISSPMMVQASSASEFRAIVQQLTGQDSDHTIYDQEGTQEQVSWVSSSKASKADTIMRFSEERRLPPAVLDQLIDENNLWEAVAESVSSYQPPCVYV